MNDVFLTTINFSFESSSENVIENALLSNQTTISNDSFSNYNFNKNLGIVRAKFGTPISVKVRNFLNSVHVLYNIGKTLLKKVITSSRKLSIPLEEIRSKKLPLVLTGVCLSCYNDEYFSSKRSS